MKQTSPQWSVRSEKERAFKALGEVRKAQLLARCQALLDKGERKSAVKFFRKYTGSSLSDAMRELGLK